MMKNNEHSDAMKFLLQQMSETTNQLDMRISIAKYLVALEGQRIKQADHAKLAEHI